jgi:trigger factor
MAFSQMRTQAERDVRGAMLLDKVAEAENVDVNEAEIEEELSKLAEYYRTTVDEVRESLKKQGGTATIENNLRTRKAIEALIGKAKITDGTCCRTCGRETKEGRKAQGCKGEIR